MDAFEQARNNPAVLKEIANAEKIVDQHAKDVTAVSVYCNQVQGYGERGWMYGFVTVSFPLKGHAALRTKLKAIGYNVEQRKRTEYDFHAYDKATTRIHVYAQKAVSLLD